MPLKLKAQRVAVEPIFDSDYYNPTSKLIKIPEMSKERCDQGIVKALGEGCDPSIKIGDHVIFSGYSGDTIVIDGELNIIVHSDFIKGTIEETHTVPGLYVKMKPDYAELIRRLDDLYYGAPFENAEQQDKAVGLALADFLNEVMIPCNNQIAANLLAQAAPSVPIKEGMLARDPIDERNR